MPPVISVQRLTRIFRAYEKEPGLFNTFKSVFKRRWVERIAVDNISFSIERGEFVGFLGPNGAGKTTTLKLLSGILRPTSGTAKVLGFVPHKRRTSFKKRISLVMGQKSQLIWDLPAQETFLLHRDLYGMRHDEWKKTKDTLVELLQLQKVLARPVRQLSLGERMKCELVTSLIHKPVVLFLDEPTIGLDVISQRNLWEFLREFQAKEETTFMLTSHYMQDIANLCSRVIVINQGKIMYDDTLDELIELTQPEKRITLRFREEISPARRQELSELATPVEMREVDPFTYIIQVPRPAFARITTQILRDFPVEDMQVEEVDLSTVMQRSFEFQKTADPSS